MNFNKRYNLSFIYIDNILLDIDYHFELLFTINIMIQIYQIFHLVIVYSYYLFDEYIEYS